MSTVVLNEDEARTLLAHVDRIIYEEMKCCVMKESSDDDELNHVSDLFSIRKKCREVVEDG